MARWKWISFTFLQKPNFKECICSYFPKPIWARECRLGRLFPPNSSYSIMKTWFLYKHSWYLTHPNETYITFKIHGTSLWKPINISSRISVLLTLSPSLPGLLNINGHILHAIWPKSFHIHCARTVLFFLNKIKMMASLNFVSPCSLFSELQEATWLYTQKAQESFSHLI